MTRKSVNLDAKIADLCDKAVSQLTKFGLKQYNSRAAYVKEACIRKLIDDGLLTEKQVTQSQSKRKVSKEVTA